MSRDQNDNVVETARRTVSTDKNKTPSIFYDRPRAASLVLALIGAANAAYLSWSHFTDTTVVCTTGTDCETVQNSIYGQVMGVPVAYLGLATYLVIVALLALEDRVDALKQSGPTLLFGLTLTGTLFSGYLQYASLFLLRATCPYCVLNAVLIALLFVGAIFRLRRALQFNAEDA